MGWGLLELLSLSISHCPGKKVSAVAKDFKVCEFIWKWKGRDPYPSRVLLFLDFTGQATVVV